MDNEEQNEILDVPPFVGEEETKKTRTAKPRSTTETVTMFHEIRGYCLCTDGKGNGYMIPSELCNSQQGLDFDVDLSSDGIIALYNWKKEIESMLPDKDELIRNVRLALWRNGAVSREAAKQNKVQQNLMRGAFPYRIEVTEEE